MKITAILIGIISFYGFGKTLYDLHDGLISEANSLKNNREFDDAIITY